MTYILQEREPRSRTVLRHTRTAIRDGRLKPLPFSERVADRYLAEVDPEDRTVNLREQGSTVETALKAKRHNHQVIDRLIQGVVKGFPMDLEEAWIAELPQPYQAQCVRDLAARRGHVAIVDPRANTAPAQQAGELSDLAREFGECMVKLAPIYADGKVDADDIPHIAAAVTELGDLITTTVQVHVRLVRVLAEGQPQAGNVTNLQRRA
ncbi:hypothetical protein LVB77_14705 [Lysobacter sp. 5GHs7-4]|uniref:hypothetical protein n=1 Tax=Lysobacter sp. 5GHs7-4 TaxID=2904253 RepID=UPI001E5D7132|nr:hypothetical protein [Lysobacter sp. 5GHs7-4]UHQ21916.1 hypothetical protein LVB77_14705 [Lysobacter sp. 5GHs7-4]